MRKLFTLLIGFCALTTVEAQVLYSCDFENATENSNWTLNKTSNSRPLANYKNIWHLGTAGNCADGTLGLHICPQTDTTVNAAIVSASTDYVVAYRDTLNLGAPGTYILSFDWRAMGKSSDILYVYWFPSTYTTATNSNYGTAGLPSGWTQYKIAELRGKTAWQSYFNTFTTPTASGKLLFAWYQAGGSVVNPPAAVDNIEIMQNTTCAAPTALSYNPAGSISWNGNASTYDVRYNNTHSDEWTTAYGLTTKTCALTNISEGTYSFQVRANCGGGVHSKWSTLSQFIWVKGLRCIDFFDYGTQPTSAGKCYVGEHQSSTSHSTLTWNPTPQMVDDGPAAATSMHTLHTEIGEVDPNTTVNGGLRTIPEGEIASIRLGAYTSSGEDARIEYKYTVQSGMSDLLDLQYACVLESGGHDADNPFFQLDILDQQGHQISGCTHAYFVADMSGTTGSGWHQEGDIFWCDWRTVTVSLTEFVGQTLTIRLTSSRCVYDTHFGYAYFTLNCRSGGLQGVACGDFETDHFTAPSGFDYEWYDPANPGVILSTDSVFHISNNDTTTYAVKVKSRLADGCYYVLVANPNPRFPETNVTYEVYQENCQNKVRFHNNSKVAIVNRVDSTKSISDDVLEDIAWDFGDGSSVIHSMDSVIEHTFPKAGGIYNVRVSSSMNGGVCTDEEVYSINIPEAGDWTSVVTDTVCYGESYSFYGKSYTTSVDTTVVLGQRVNMCDSLAVLHLTVLPELKSQKSDTTICFGDKIAFGKNTISATGIYTAKFPGAHGCDSTVTWKVNVKDEIKPNVVVTPIVEDGDLGAFHITGTGYTYYTINGVRHEVTDTDITGLTPDTYLLIFYNDIGCEKPLTYDLGQGCVANFVYQRWNDVLSVKSPEYAGGRSYKKYQWMKNGVDVPGATKSYYAAAQYPETEPDGHLDFNAVYEVALAADSLATTEWLVSCPYRPINLLDAIDNIAEGVLLEPTYVKTGGLIWLLTPAKAQVVCYNPSGVKVFSTEVNAGHTTFEAPSVSGMYVITIFTGNSKKSYKICVAD